MELNWPEPTEWPALSAGEIHVWAVPLDHPETPWPELEAALAPPERERALQFVREAPRRSFAVTRAALRAILGRYLTQPPAGVSLTHDSHGKPQLVGVAASGLAFNVSHGGELALVAVTRDGEVGVDVEPVRPIDQWHQLAARNFHPAEADAIRAATDAERSANFFRCWTRKEAVLKAIGLGLGYPLDAFDVLTRRGNREWIDLPAYASTPPTRCWVRDIDPSPGYLAAVATTREMPPPLGFTYYL